MAETTIDFVMGKGGVGRTTTSRLLAHQYADRGETTIIVECNGCADIPALYDINSRGYTPTKIATGIDTISISPMAAIEDYVIQQLKMRKLYTLIFDNRLVKPLIEAAPGLHDAVQLGKIYDLQISGKWEHIVVDCPATGHGISLISSAKTMMELSKRGPLYKQNKLVEDIINRHSRILLVTLAEELPVSETLQLWNTMRRDFQEKVMGILVNQWQQISPTLQDALISPGTSSYFDAYPDYQTVYNILCEQHLQQKTWHEWLQTELSIPNNLPLLTYDRWSPHTNTNLPTLSALGEWV
jgi:anion-transporting  ArsA/GET3 family ATPase